VTTKINRNTRKLLLAEACADGADFLRSRRTLKDAYHACSDPAQLCWAFEKIGMGDDERLRAAAREIAAEAFGQHFSREDEKVASVWRWLDHGREADREAASSAAMSAASSASCDTIRKHLPWGSF